MLVSTCGRVHMMAGLSVHLQMGTWELCECKKGSVGVHAHEQ